MTDTTSPAAGTLSREAAAKITSAYDRLHCLELDLGVGGAFEATGIYIGHFGPALQAALEYQAGRFTHVTFGPDSPMAGKRLDVVLRGFDLPADQDQRLAEAMDEVAGAVCPPPGSDVDAVTYIGRLKAGLALLCEHRETLINQPYVHGPVRDAG
jgi:hypothetical protein